MEDPVKTLTAADVMTRGVLAVRPDWSVDELVSFLTDNSISGAPVVGADETPLGVVSVTDVARCREGVDLPVDRVPSYFTQGLERKIAREEARSYQTPEAAETMVQDIMTPMVFGVEESATVQEVADAMIRGRIHRVFVTNRGKMVGVISSMDLLPLIRDS
jgi:predicted transcriptional regulator